MKRKVIIDCDPGIDDSLAIMLALSMEEIEVVGITIVCGNCPVDMGFGNAKKVLKHMNRLDIPVFKGEEKPLVRAYVNALDTHGSDGLGESFIPEVEGYEQKETAVEFMARVLRENARDCSGNVQKDNVDDTSSNQDNVSRGISVIALGPMTNLAKLIETDEDAFMQIDEIISMGGNFRSHGNCSPVAEYNYWVDPDAAALVYEEMLHLGRKIHMVGLDVTRKIVLTPDILEYIKRLDEKQGKFIMSITKFYYDFHWKWEHLIGCVINDPLAVAYFADRSLCSGIEAYTAVETEGISVGQTVVDSMNFYNEKANAVVLTDTASAAFFRLFISKIIGVPEEKLDLIDTLVRRG